MRQGLADCLFCFAAQSGLPKDDVISIIDFLKANADVESDGKLSPTTIAIVFALLYSLKPPAQMSSDDFGGKTVLL